MSIWCSSFGCIAYPYEGSSVMPSIHGERMRLGIAYPAAHIPTRLEAAKGKDYIDSRENGFPAHPWLRFTTEDMNAFVMHERDVVELHEFLGRWLEVRKLKRVG